MKNNKISILFTANFAILMSTRILMFIGFTMFFWACKPKYDNQIIKKIFFETKTIYGSEVLLRDQLFKLKNKKVAVVCNLASWVNDSINLVDALLKNKIQITKIFAPEHGFRKVLEAGKYFQDTIDSVTGIPIVSLYGKKMKPTPESLIEVDIVLFDIQDVGCRFYTYLTTLVQVMEACAENGKTLMVLDRPNPNGFYVAGPVLEPGFESFQGLHPIPIVHGMTFAEYARMVNQEGWLKNGIKCNLEIVKCENYVHEMRWRDTQRKWFPPSPNLRTPEAAEWYPILCWYEGTNVSVGRGTETPFQLVGFPYHRALQKIIIQDSLEGTQSNIQILGHSFQVKKFTPQADPIRALNPLYKNQTCYGLFLNQIPENTDTLFLIGLELLQNFYNEYKEYQKFYPNVKNPFFKDYFYELVGNKTLRTQIENKVPTQEILASWQKSLNNFKNLRKKYLLYK